MIRYLKLYNIAMCVFFIINGTTDEVRILGMLLLPLCILAWFQPSTKQEKENAKNDR